MSCKRNVELEFAAGPQLIRVTAPTIGLWSPGLNKAESILWIFVFATVLECRTLCER